MVQELVDFCMARQNLSPPWSLQLTLQRRPLEPESAHLPPRNLPAGDRPLHPHSTKWSTDTGNGWASNLFDSEQFASELTRMPGKSKGVCRGQGPGLALELHELALLRRGLFSVSGCLRAG